MSDIVELGIDHMHMLAECLTGDRFVIGGGYARDLLNDKPIKDIDIFINTSSLPLPALDSYNKHTAKLGYNRISKNSFYAGKKTENGNSFQTFSKEGALVQYIEVQKDPLVFIEETFDFGLCQAAIDINGDFWTSAAYNADTKKQMLTIMVRPTITNYQLGLGIADHLPRMHKKYPHHKFMIAHMEQDDADRMCKMRKYYE